MQTEAICTSFQEQRIEDVFIELLKENYTTCSMIVQLHKERTISTTGVRQGDSISPKLFTAALKSVLRRLTWEFRDVMIDGEYRSHFLFADGKLICANTPHELQQILQDIDENENKGMKMDKSKTNVMMENHTPICVNHTQIENVDSYIYLGQIYTTRD